MPRDQKEPEEKMDATSMQKLIVVLQLTIFVALIALMWSLNSGCIAATNYYTQDTQPDLHLVGHSRFGGYRVLEFVVSNPRSDRRHYSITCATEGSEVVERVVVPPRSDVAVSVTVGPGYYHCGLVPDIDAGSEH